MLIAIWFLIIYLVNNIFLIDAAGKFSIIMENDYPFDETKQLFDITESIQVKKVIYYDAEARFIIK